MPDCLVVIPSLNQAALLKRALYREGVFVEMMRTPGCLSATGCSFALRCKEQEIDLIARHCRQLSIVLGGAFAEDVGYGTVGYRRIEKQP